jgi:hypothetical protein
MRNIVYYEEHITPRSASAFIVGIEIVVVHDQKSAALSNRVACAAGIESSTTIEPHNLERRQVSGGYNIQCFGLGQQRTLPTTTMQRFAER